MTPEEAIRILEEDTRYTGEGSVPNIVKAERLGIEALKLIQRQSPNRTLPGTELLPGETVE